jgi:hypothetical protein
MIDHNPKEVEYYDNVDQVIEEDDLVEVDIKIIGWKRKFRIRALTFEQMEDINLSSIDEKTGKLDPKLFVYMTITAGVVRPRIKLEQAKKLASNNGENVRALSDEIWNIGRVSKEVFDNYINALKALPDETATKS